MSTFKSCQTESNLEEPNNGNDFLSIAWNRITLGGPAHEIPTRTMSNPGFDQGGPGF